MRYSFPPAPVGPVDEYEHRRWFGNVKERFDQLALPWIDIRDRGGGTRASAATNAAALVQARNDLNSETNGGIIYVPRGEYDLKGSQVSLPANVHLVTDNLAHNYDTNGFAGGTVFYVADGDWGIRLSGRHSGIHGLRIQLDSGGTCTYGVVASGDGAINTVLNVAARGFPYNIAVANVNNMRLDISTLLATKIGFSVLPGNSDIDGIGGDTVVGDYAFPLISDLVTGITSTIMRIQIQSESNKIGMAFLAGLGVTVGGISESNQYHGVMIFKRDNTTNGFTFGGKSRFHMEDDASVLSPTAWDITGIEHLKTSSTEYLKGDVEGEYDSGEHYSGIWIGSKSELYTAGSGNEGSGPATGIYFAPNCTLIPNGNVFRIRSARKTTVDRSYLQSATTSTDFSVTDNCYKLKIIDPWGNLHDQVRLMQIGGTGTTYEINDPKAQTISAAANDTFQNIVDVSSMSKGNKYEYTIMVVGEALTFAHGMVTYDGTTTRLAEYITSSEADVQLSTNTLQYKQITGGSADISFKIFCRGPMEYA